MRPFTLLLLVFMLSLMARTFAQEDSEHTQFGHDIHIAAGEREICHPGTPKYAPFIGGAR